MNVTGLSNYQLYSLIQNDKLDPSIKMTHYLRLILVSFTAIPLIASAQNSYSPTEEAQKLFNTYKPIIEKKNNAIVDNPRVIAGDINGDNKIDCIISFVMTSKNGGNLIIGYGSEIYLNIGTGMKVAGAFPELGFCYTLDQIKGQIIYAKEHECQPPYLKIIRQRKFAYAEGKIKIIL